MKPLPRSKQSRIRDNVYRKLAKKTNIALLVILALYFVKQVSENVAVAIAFCIVIFLHYCLHEFLNKLAYYSLTTISSLATGATLTSCYLKLLEKDHAVTCLIVVSYVLLFSSYALLGVASKHKVVVSEKKRLTEDWKR